MSHATVQSHQDITHRFGYHAPTPERIKAHEEIRAACTELAHLFDTRLPDGEDKADARKHIEYALRCANAAIALEKD